MTGDTLTTSPTGTRLQIPGRTAAARLIVVVRAPEAAGYDRVLEVLVDAGIRSVELTLTTPGTIARLPRLIAQFGEDADIGVGTVTNGDQLAAAVEAGAHYLVTPITDPALVDAANRAAVPIVPGGLTPTELFAAWRAGAAAVKIFPRQPGWPWLPERSARTVPRYRGGAVRRCGPSRRRGVAAGRRGGGQRRWPATRRRTARRGSGRAAGPGDSVRGDV